jgi:hypothetical protein
LQATTYNVAIHENTIPTPDWVARAIPGVSVTEGQTLTGKDFKLERGGIVSGTVRLADGAPAPNEEIGIYGPAHPDNSGWVGNVRTKADGTFQVRLPSGHHRFYPMANVQDNKFVDLADGQTAKVDFEIPHASPH